MLDKSFPADVSTLPLYFSYLDNFAYPNTILLNSENNAVQITEVPLYNIVIMLFHVVGGGSPLVCSDIVVLLLVSFAVSII